MALMLISSLAACGPDEQQAQVAAPESTVAAESEAAAMTETPKMPEMLDMSGRFADMFVSEVTDTFNPGLQIGDRFPAIRAVYQGEEITTIDRFIRDRGAIFIAARSVDW